MFHLFCGASVLGLRVSKNRAEIPKAARRESAWLALKRIPSTVRILPTATLSHTCLLPKLAAAFTVFGCIPSRNSLKVWGSGFRGKHGGVHF